MHTSPVTITTPCAECVGVGGFREEQNGEVDGCQSLRDSMAAPCTCGGRERTKSGGGRRVLAKPAYSLVQTTKAES
jgi:hypothetical protein